MAATLRLVAAAIVLAAALPLLCVAQVETLVVGGGFSKAGGAPASSVAQWDGSAWSDMAGGMFRDGSAGYSYEIIVYEGKPVVGGQFVRAGSTNASNIAQWDGTAWSALGAGANGPVYSGGVYQDTTGHKLAVMGSFTMIGDQVTDNDGQWDGATWQTMNLDAEGGVVTTVAQHGTSALYFGGGFTSIGAVAVDCIAGYNFLQFYPLVGGGVAGNGTSAGIEALVIDGDRMYVGGYFTTAGAVVANNIAMYDLAAQSWSPLGSGIATLESDMVLALAVYNNELIAAGFFSSAGGVIAHNIAKWNGSAWSPLGSGIPTLNSIVYCLTVFQGKLVAGGLFSDAGSVQVNNIAQWNGTSWSALGSGVEGDESDNGYVVALAVYIDTTATPPPTEPPTTVPPTTAPPTTTPPTTAPPENSDKPGPLIIALVVVVIIIAVIMLAGLGYFIYRRYSASAYQSLESTPQPQSASANASQYTYATA